MAESFRHVTVFADDEFLALLEHAARFNCLSHRRIITENLFCVCPFQHSYLHFTAFYRNITAVTPLLKFINLSTKLLLSPRLVIRITFLEVDDEVAFYELN